MRSEPADRRRCARRYTHAVLSLQEIEQLAGKLLIQVLEGPISLTGGLVVAQGQIRRSQIVLRFGKVRLEICGFLVVLNSFAVALALAVNETQVVAGRCEIRLKFYRLLQHFDGFLVAAKKTACNAQVTKCFSKVRLDLDGPFEGFGGLLDATQLMKRGPEVVMSCCGIWIEFDRLLKQVDRLIGPTHLAIYVSQISLCFAKARSNSNRVKERLDCFSVTPELAISHSEIVMRG